MSDYYNIIDTAAEEAEKRGMAKGMEIGREEGREEGMVEMLKKMFESGMGYKEISQISGLSESQVQTYLQK